VTDRSADSFRQNVYAERGSSVYAVLHGDMHIRNGAPVYRIEPFPLAPRVVSVEKARRQPSRLLDPESQVVGFTGRDRELTALAEWRDDPAPGVSVMLVHAAGGQGKTRLAGRFAADSVRRGWTAWAAHHLSDPTPADVVTPGDAGWALLLVVDYADRWPVDDLLLLLLNPLLRRPQRSRVLLVARPAGPWWPALRHRLGKADIDVAGSLRLPPLAETAREQREVFDAAGGAFAAALGADASPLPAPTHLGEAAFQAVLSVHMAALVAIDARARGEIAASDPVSLSAYLLDREHDFWQSVYDHDDRVATAPGDMGRVVYTATLTRPLPRERGIAALGRVGVAAPREAGRMVDDHAVCYPPAGSDGMVLEPLYPDRLGEDFVALLTPGHNHDGYEPDSWAGGAVGRLLGPDDESGDRPGDESGDPPAPYTRPAVTVLIETAYRWPHVAHRQMEPLLRRAPEHALAAGGAALARLTEIPDIDVEVLEAVDAHLPHRDVDLDVGIAALTTRLIEHRVSASDDPAHHAELYATLGWRLGNAGDYHGAFAATEHAVKIYERLAATDPTVEPDLAVALTNLGSALSELGRLEDALVATEDAVRRYRGLPPADLYACQAELAQALNHLSVDLAVLGRQDQAVAANEEAIEIYQRLASEDPETFEPDLAKATLNLGVRLSDLGQAAPALDATERAVAIYRRLAEAKPGEFEPSLAGTLNNLGLTLTNVGRTEAALSVAMQSAEVYRRLAATNPAAFGSDHAMALNSLSQALSDLGRHEEALAAAEQAVDVRRELAAANPAAAEPDLARVLNNLSVRLLNLHRHDESLAAAEQAVEIRRRLAAANPAAFESGLAAALTNLAAALSPLGRREEALAAAEQAVGIRRRLSVDHPDAFEPSLATALGAFASMLLATRSRPADALAAATQAAEIFQRLAVDARGRYTNHERAALRLRADAMEML
jgi:tetratricopeptide (TPR) repeat protein